MSKIINRCTWVNMNNSAYVQYHDTEWGVPRHSDSVLFEMLILESFQAGLSWECVLNKREAFRAAFDNFDALKISGYDESKCAELMQNPGIIRNRLKISAAVTNSRVFLEIQKEFGSFDRYLWGFTQGQVVLNTDDEVRASSELSDRVSTDLKRRGMKFVGTVIIYSFLQAVGVVNDHEMDCWRYPH